jgi:endogenous inhibitor of DNA gyrase (YacG/DUF329 family)
MLQRILNEAKEVAENKRRNPYWAECPACGRQVVKKELTNKRCYICGWEGTKEELELAKSKSVIGRVKGAVTGQKERQGSYRINCPHCGRRVIREEFENNGCFICGFTV